MRKGKSAPPGCYWRNRVLWGRAKVKGVERRWSLHTDDPKIARERRKAGKAKLHSVAHHGDARFTFEEVIVPWSSWIEKQVGPRTAHRYATSLNVLAPFLEGKHLDEVDGRLVTEIIRARQSVDDVSNATIKRDLTALSSVLTYAIGQDWLESNPVLPKLRLIKERRDPIVLPRVEDVEKIIARAPGLFAALIKAAWATGCRQEELAQAKWSQLDLRAKRLTIIGKGNKPRVIDLEPFSGIDLFASLPSGIGDAPLFWHDDGLPYSNVASRFGFLMRQLVGRDESVRRFRFHDLRHLHAVEWLRSGRSIYSLQQRLGHSSIQVTESYLKYLTGDEQNAVKFGSVDKHG
jgi:integrase/recombinase XerD